MQSNSGVENETLATKRGNEHVTGEVAMNYQSRPVGNIVITMGNETICSVTHVVHL